jgi:hypothetical protein
MGRRDDRERYRRCDKGIRKKPGSPAERGELTWNTIERTAYGRLKLKPWELEQYSPFQFIQALIGLREEDTEQWRHARYVAWAAIIAQRGSKDLASPKDLFKLPGDNDEINIKREDFDEVFKLANEKWTQP